MKILSLKMVDFRQYLGEQVTIHFASEKENVTIIFGENGKGKTGVFRALMFALFNYKHIQQDNKKEKIHLVNLLQLNKNPNTPWNASVTVKFEHNNKQYEIYRTVVGMKVGSQVQERDGEVRLTEIDEHGNYSASPIVDPIEVKRIMNTILDEEIKDFFLFDGEKIDTLAKTNEVVKKEVKSAIFKLLQIDNVEEARHLLNQLKNTERRSVVNNTTDVNVTKKNSDIESIQNEIAGQKFLLEKYEQELIDSNKLIEELELQLSQNEEISKIQSDLKMAKEKENLIKDHLSTIKGSILKLILGKTPYLMMNRPFHNVKNYLETTISENDSVVPLEILRESINKQVCVCCNNDLVKHNENLKYVESLIVNYIRSESSDFANGILAMISSSFEEANTIEEDSIAALKSYLQKEKELRNISEEVHLLEIELGVKASKELNLEKTSRSLKFQKNHSELIKSKIAESRVKMETFERELQKAEADLQRMLRTLNNNKIEERVIEIIDTLTSDIDIIAKGFSSSMREKLRDITTMIFKKIIDTKDVHLVKSININERFEIEIISHDDIEITQDISQGQRQIVALAFITALAQVAAGEDNIINFPLFMDSPFNRLSGMNRDHLIDNIPNLTSQWILLLTDTELTMSEERVFKKGGRLGKWYRINQLETYHSQIEEVALSEMMTTRGM